MRTADRWTALGAFLLFCAPAADARAADGLLPAISTVGSRPPREGGMWQGAAGFRTTLVRDKGYDPFSTNDVLPQVSLSVTRALCSGPGLCPAMGLLWEGGGSSAAARGTDATLTLQRLAVSFEGRLAPRRDIYLTARVSPGVLLASASLTDPSAPEPLETRYASLSVDGSLGAAVRVNPEANVVGFWVLADAGYGWTPRRDLVLAPALPAADRDKAGATPLGSLTTRGAFMRFALALSY
jgi:hypothetical protein